jgi:hypothetical protein
MIIKTLELGKNTAHLLLLHTTAEGKEEHGKPVASSRHCQMHLPPFLITVIQP